MVELSPYSMLPLGGLEAVDDPVCAMAALILAVAAHANQNMVHEAHAHTAAKCAIRIATTVKNWRETQGEPDGNTETQES